jgi:hypothetical protein
LPRSGPGPRPRTRLPGSRSTVVEPHRSSVRPWPTTSCTATRPAVPAAPRGKPSQSRSDGLRTAMFTKLASEAGKACYATRKQTVEPVFGQLKEHQGARGSSAAGWPPARPSGSCCAAPTTCSSSGATPAARPHPHRAPPKRRRPPRSPVAPADYHGCPAMLAGPTPDRSAAQAAGGGIEASPFSNTLVRVKARVGPRASSDRRG